MHCDSSHHLNNQKPRKAEPFLVGVEQDGQRLDNFLAARWRRIPKARIFRAIRQGEIRVNGKRVDAHHRLVAGDFLRIPPWVEKDVPLDTTPAIVKQFKAGDLPVLFENDRMILINKPAGIPVHGGSGLSGGAVDVLRHWRSDLHYLELVHRLDKETSGCLLLAKRRSVLTQLQQQWQEQKVEKQYLALVAGHWLQAKTIQLPLRKNILQSGERMVVVDSVQGKAAETWVEPLQQFGNFTLVAAYPKTGRTHQIRVHLASQGHPIVGDEKYGDKTINREFRARNPRLFLHAYALRLEHKPGELFYVGAPVSAQWWATLLQLK